MGVTKQIYIVLKYAFPTKYYFHICTCWQSLAVAVLVRYNCGSADHFCDFAKAVISSIEIIEQNFNTHTSEYLISITHKQLEIHGSVLSTVAIDVMVLTNQAMSSYNGDQILIVYDHFHTKILQFYWKYYKNKIMFWT